jgi:hypothetical protein
MRGARPFGFECRKEHRDEPTPRSANGHGRRQSRQPDHFVKFQGGKSEVPSKAATIPNARWRDENPCAERGLLGSNAGRSIATCQPREAQIGMAAGNPASPTTS